MVSLHNNGKVTHRELKSTARGKEDFKPKIYLSSGCVWESIRGWAQALGHSGDLVLPLLCSEV